jgi:hypothetical protein
MWIYALFILVLIGLLLVYRKNALSRFDKDPDQHYLMTLMVGIAAGRKHATEADLRAHLDRIASSPANRRARVIHAVLLARKGAPPALYDTILELSRRLR